ncbi:YjgN family protein [Sphingomonas sp.]|uniref:YjgN family protein n=1 Tax=Sphingomonas sp. TaxID=28214 RepID=UPI0028AAB157|nr:YjgN family protein [Sphingomonas sp.]
MKDQGERGAFEFYGSWREYAPIAFSNLLLTIVTLGIYTFWGRTRTRRYLWSQTRFIDDRLEWTGTGRELMLGYVVVMLLLFVPVAGLNLLVGTLAMQGTSSGAAAAGLLFLLLYLFLFVLGGVAIFRALRYRLSRTYWHGIRGGSDDQGFRYGLSYLWRMMLGSAAFGLMVPWALVNLWNQRWNAMSFGPYPFRSRASSDGLMRRYLLFYLLPVALVIGGVVVVVISLAFGVTPQTAPGPVMPLFLVGGFLLFYVLFLVLFGLISLSFYAAYFRQGIGAMTLGQLEFEFTARTGDWVKLMLGTIALVVGTLGIGSIFIGYRNWAFFVRHLRAYGTLELDQFTQSTTRAPGQGEGLFDGLDMGAF